jgi:hypothetical protein
VSRRDRYHDALRRTLEKDGWMITADPLILRLEGIDLKADLGVTVPVGDKLYAKTVSSYEQGFQRSLSTGLEAF